MDKKKNKKAASFPGRNSSCALCSKRHLYLSCPAEWKNEQACTCVVTQGIFDMLSLQRRCLQSDVKVGVYT